MFGDLAHWFTKGGDLAGWISSAEASIRADPFLSAGVAGVLLLTCAMSRSFSFAAASILCCAMFLFRSRIREFDLPGGVFAASIICVQVLILTGSLGFRWRVSREKSARNALLAEKNAIQERLDQEVRWRRASEETAADVPASGSV